MRRAEDRPAKTKGACACRAATSLRILLEIVQRRVKVRSDPENTVLGSAGLTRPRRADRLMTMEASVLFNWSSKIVQRLLANPAEMKRLLNFRFALQQIPRMRIQILADIAGSLGDIKRLLEPLFLLTSKLRQLSLTFESSRIRGMPRTPWTPGTISQCPCVALIWRCTARRIRSSLGMASPLTNLSFLPLWATARFIVSRLSAALPTRTPTPWAPCSGSWKLAVSSSG